MILRASCLCQSIILEIDGPVHDMLFCHCSMCRKAHGAAFRARGRVKTANLRWVRGEELIALLRIISR
ncbi:GFA family protein [Nitrosomonas eutropha]|uniref:GFA family protein n=1 Tax=Nitrosomonas eutropha TaxID=916 RepID=UPI00094452F1